MPLKLPALAATVAGLLTSLLASLLVALPATPASAVPVPPPPLAWDAPVADPSVVRGGPGYVVVATGALATRRQSGDGLAWAPTSPALAYLPSWATSGALWASDMAKVRGRWVLYFAAPVLGLGRLGRCVGVAVAASPLEPFVPVGDAPLVCPRRALTPPAQDTVSGGRGLPKLGVIDPSVHLEGRRRYLLYKVDGVPSEIRLVRLRPDGLSIAGAGRDDRSRRDRTRADRRGGRRDTFDPSVTLVRADKVVENPVLLQRRGTYYLFTSVGFFGDCAYQTTWRRSASLTSWKGHRPRRLLSHRRTGLCGPGGADVIADGKHALVYFAAWTCARTPSPCPWGFRAERPDGPGALRALYGARLQFTRRGRPVLDEWLVPTVAGRETLLLGEEAPGAGPSR